MNSRTVGISFIALAGIFVAFSVVQLAIGSADRDISRRTSTPRKQLLDPGDDIQAPEILSRTGRRRFTMPEGLQLKSNDRKLLSLEEWELIDKGDDYLYTVQDGDSINNIASRYLGDSTLKSRIIEFNPGLRPSDIQAGTRVVIPLRYRR